MMLITIDTEDDVPENSVAILATDENGPCILVCPPDLPVWILLEAVNEMGTSAIIPYTSENPTKSVKGVFLE